jgi:formylglycine-generating enzyme required for sulfatase activity
MAARSNFIKATGWYYANSDKKTHPVGQKAPNASGIYDLIGMFQNGVMIGIAGLF